MHAPLLHRYGPGPVALVASACILATFMYSSRKELSLILKKQERDIRTMHRRGGIRTKISRRQKKSRHVKEEKDPSTGYYLYGRSTELYERVYVGLEDGNGSGEGPRGKGYEEGWLTQGAVASTAAIFQAGGGGALACCWLHIVPGTGDYVC